MSQSMPRKFEMTSWGSFHRMREQKVKSGILLLAPLLVMAFAAFFPAERVLPGNALLQSYINFMSSIISTIPASARISRFPENTMLLLSCAWMFLPYYVVLCCYYIDDEMVLYSFMKAKLSRRIGVVVGLVFLTVMLFATMYLFLFHESDGCRRRCLYRSMYAQLFMIMCHITLLTLLISSSWGLFRSFCRKCLVFLNGDEK
jgi:hypothetical protein